MGAKIFYTEHALTYPQPQFLRNVEQRLPEEGSNSTSRRHTWSSPNTASPKSGCPLYIAKLKKCTLKCF